MNSPVGATGALQYATGDPWRSNSRKNEGMEPKQKEYPAVDVTGDRSKVRCCKEQYCIGTWNVRSIPLLSFIEPIFEWNFPLAFLILLKRSLVFPILLFSSFSLQWLLRKAFLSLLAILWNSAFKWVYLSFFPLLFANESRQIGSGQIGDGKSECRHSAAAAAKSLQSCPTLCDPIDDSPSGSSIPGILQARTLEWVAISFSNAGKWKVKVKSLSHVRMDWNVWI